MCAKCKHVLLLFTVCTITIAYNNALSSDSNGVTTLFKCSRTVGELGNTLEIPEYFMTTNETHVFNLTENKSGPSCAVSDRFEMVMDLSKRRNNSVFFPDGILIVNRDTDDADVDYYRNKMEYCVKSMKENSTLTLSVCEIGCREDSRRPCIHKCCSPGQSLVLIEGEEGEPSLTGCQSVTPSTKKWKPILYESYFKEICEKENSLVQPIYFTDYSIFNGCEVSSVYIQPVDNFNGTYHQDVNLEIGFHLLKNGDLAYCMGNGETLVARSHDFCVDELQNFSDDKDSDSIENLTAQAVILCNSRSASHRAIFYKYHVTEKALDTVLYKIMIPFASVFLLLIIIVYTLLWEKQNVHGYTIFTYVLSLFLLFLSLTISKTLNVKTVACTIFGITNHFFFISTFCWLTAINFDVWWTFRNLKACRESKHIRRFLIYAALCCALPTILITIGIANDTNYDVKVENNCSIPSSQKMKLPSPIYGVKICGMQNSAQGLYNYLPAGILLGSNAIFFAMTVYTMYNYRKSTDLALRGRSQKADKPVWLFTKLFLVMGIGWFVEFVGWTLKTQYPDDGSILWIIWVLDTFNVIQAVAIFYIFICKRVIYVQLWQKHVWLRSLLSLCVMTGCCDVPPERISANTTFSTAGSGRSRKISTVSILSQPCKLQQTSEL